MNSTDPKAPSLSSKQVAYLGKLITQHGKAKYLEAKQQAGIPADVTLLQLTRLQASRLIDALRDDRQ